MSNQYLVNTNLFPELIIKKLHLCAISRVGVSKRVPEVKKKKIFKKLYIYTYKS